MAIHTEVPGLVVTVNVNGRDLPEYDDGSQASVQSTWPFTIKYVEATTGARFGIVAQFTPEYEHQDEDHIITVAIDGKYLGWAPVRRDRIQAHERVGFGGVRETVNGVDEAYGFIMGEIATGKDGTMHTRSRGKADLLVVDGPADESLFGRLRDLGTITVGYSRVQPLEAVDSMPSTDAEVLSNLMKPALADGVVPKESLRASGVTHQLEYVTFSWECCGLVYILY